MEFGIDLAMALNDAVERTKEKNAVDVTTTMTTAIMKMSSMLMTSRPPPGALLVGLATASTAR